LFLNRGSRSVDIVATKKDFISPQIISGVVKLIDFAAIVLISIGAYEVYLTEILNSYEDIGRYLITSASSALFFLIVFQWIGGYQFDRFSFLSWQLPRVVLVWFGSFSFLLTLAFTAKVSSTYSRGWAISWIIGVGLFLPISRIILKLAIVRWSRQGYFLRNIVVVGASEVGKRFIDKLRRSPDSGARIVGVFDDRTTRILPLDKGIHFLGSTDDLLKFARKTPVDEIIIALPLNAGERLRILFEKLKSLPVDLRLSIEPLAGMFSVNGLDKIIDMPLLQIAERPLKQWNAVIKKFEDVILTSILLVIFAPAMAVIALIIKFDSPGPVFFVQERFGFNNEAIRVLKFRTMYYDKGDPAGGKRTVRNDPRVTRSGRFLRAFSLDELPQLINVLRGEMSLVGPRPHAIAMKAGDRLYHEAVDTYAQRHRVKPGITGWAQVNGMRGEIDTLEKARRRVTYDLEYVEHWSLGLDLKILMMSIGAVFKWRNAY
jgi:Undecaprenyl-phosphate glucose phosphotransferase